MQPKQFQGTSIDEVLPQIRAELGDGAVIIATKRVVRGGIGGFFGKEGIEVTASAGAAPRAGTLDVRTPDTAGQPEQAAAANLAAAESAATSAPPAPAPFSRHLQGRLDAALEAEDGFAPHAPVGAAAYAAAGAPAPFAPGGDERGAAILEAARDAVRQARATAEGSLRALQASGHEAAPAPDAPPAAAAPAPVPAPSVPAPARRPLEVAAPAPAPPPVFGEIEAPEPIAPGRPAPVPVHRRLAGVRRDLLATGLDERHLAPMLDAFARERLPFLDGEDVRAALATWLAGRLPVARDWAPRGGGRMVALVGQSGVGKTAAVIGLAQRYRAAGVAVGVVALGDEPNDVLEGATRRLGVPSMRAEGTDALVHARTAFGTNHLMIVDTPGRSHRDTAAIGRMAAVIAPAKLDAVHLVLPVGSAEADITDLVRGFRPLGFSRLVLTKLDETRCTGNLVNLPLRIGKAVAYLSDAPLGAARVRQADPTEIAGLLLR